MKEWSKDIVVNVPIEQLWSLFNGSLEDMQKIMPQVVENKPVKVTDEGVGSIYRQKYKEGKRVQEYDVVTTEYSNTPEKKSMKVEFTLANMFEITAAYELTKQDENQTHFRYTTTNKPLKWFIKPFLMLAGDKVVVQFVERVKKVAEEESLQHA